MITPLLSGFSQMTVTLASSAPTVATMTAGVIKDFFKNIFLNPGNSYTATLIIVACVVAPFAGLIFLIKWIFDKVFPERLFG